MDHVSRAGIKNVGVIIAPETGSVVKEYVKDGFAWNIKVTYIVSRTARTSSRRKDSP